MRKLALLVALAGCNQIFGLEKTHLSDAKLPDAVFPDALDSDDDGIPDLGDNCPAIANRGQEDYDHDGVGDACDTCPMLPSPRTGDDSDGDGVPDVCDPHPNESRDCLILFDHFTDPSAFASHWLVSGAGTATAVGPGQIRVVPQTSGTVTLVDTTLSGTLSIHVQGSDFAPMGGHIAAFTQSPSNGEGVACGYYFTKVLVSFNDGSMTDLMPGSLSGPPAYNGYFLRLAVDTYSPNLSINFYVYCRVDAGAQVGAAALAEGMTRALTTGVTGIEVADDAATINAVAVYLQVSQSASCPTTIIR